MEITNTLPTITAMGLFEINLKLVPTVSIKKFLSDSKRLNVHFEIIMHLFIDIDDWDNSDLFDHFMPISNIRKLNSRWYASIFIYTNKWARSRKKRVSYPKKIRTHLNSINENWIRNTLIFFIFFLYFLFHYSTFFIGFHRTPCFRISLPHYNSIYKLFYKVYI